MDQCGSIPPSPLDPEITDDRPVHAEGVVIEDLADGLVVAPSGGEGVILNNTAAFVFELCRGDRDLQEIAAEIARAFGLDRPPLHDVELCVDELREREVLRPRISAPTASVRVLAFTCSRDRPVLLRNCILQMRAQTHPVDHVVYLNGPDDDSRLYDDLAGSHLIFRLAPSRDRLTDPLVALDDVDLEDYDLFCKVDDDDVYRADYIEGVVADFVRHGWDYSGSHSDGWIRGSRWLTGGVLGGLGPQSEYDAEHGVIYIMPPTAAFSRRAIAYLLSLDQSSPPPGLDIDGINEDAIWGRAITYAGLRTRVRATARFIYHVHGTNASTAHWLAPNDE